MKGEKIQEFCHFSRNKRLSSNVTRAINSGYDGILIRRFNQYREILENKAFKDVTKTDKNFSPVGWVMDMVAANFNGLQLIYVKNILNKIKGCKFHFHQ